MKAFISPSIMCCEFDQYDRFIKEFEEKEVKNIHFDVMDGHYVDNIMLGTTTYKELKKRTILPIDIHLMCEKPERFLEMFAPMENDWVCFHPETTNHPHALLLKIKDLGCKAGYAINPGTPLSYIEEVVDLLDYIVVMAVNPGFAGQKMVDSHINKLKDIKSIVNNSKRHIEIVVDGNTTYDNGRSMVEAGATGLIVGTSSLLKDVSSFASDYNKYKQYVNREQVE